jgi:signal transduction histidine kinase
MNTLPDAIQNYLHNFLLGQGKFAYLSFDQQGLIKDCHPNLAYYGLIDLRSGDDAIDRLLFLAGLIPFQETEVFILPAVNFANEIAADIHILPAIADEIYVLFFDVTEAVAQRQKLQQEHYNIELLYQQQNKNIQILKQTYQELELKKKQAELANKTKTQLLSYISHDLKTPLTSILGFSQFLEGNVFGELNEEQHNCVETIRTAGKYMNDLITEIMEAARLESGNVQLHLQSIQASDIIAECLSWLQPLAEKQQLKLINRITTAVNIQADAQRFTQIMMNVLNNAIKYNRKQGCIILSCKVQEDSLRIIVKDTGIGITEQQMSKMFQPFARVLDQEKAKRIEGDGIGLNESKLLVELMQGSLSLRSELNVGSVFYIDLPLSEESKSNVLQLTPPRLLYFYHDSIYFELFHHFLTTYKNYQIFGSDQTAQIMQLSTQHDITVLLVEMDCEHLATEIEKLLLLKSQLKGVVIIAVFEKQTPAVVIHRVLEQAQLEDYLIRPFDFNQLQDIL